jgi:hypothetical protein
VEIRRFFLRIPHEGARRASCAKLAGAAPGATIVRDAFREPRLAPRFRPHRALAPMSSPPSDPPPPDHAPGVPPERPATVSEIVRAVLWSFFGVRKGQAMQRDLVTIKPHQVIVVGILIAAVVVALLLILVRFITRGL